MTSKSSMFVKCLLMHPYTLYESRDVQEPTCVCFSVLKRNVYTKLYTHSDVKYWGTLFDFSLKDSTSDTNIYLKDSVIGSKREGTNILFYTFTGVLQIILVGRQFATAIFFIKNVSIAWFLIS